MIAAMVFVMAACASAALMPGTIRLAVKTGWLDRPSQRKSHARSVPLLGGVAVFAAAALGLACARCTDADALALLAASAAMVALGAADDRFDLPARWRLAAQLAVATGLAWLGARGHVLPASLDIVAAVLWMAGLANAVNCLDCADGAASIYGASALAGYGVLALLTGSCGIGLLCLACAGACLGFLPYNLPRARIFLGDAGSTFLGFLIGAVSLVMMARTGLRVSPWLTAGPGLVAAADLIVVHARRYAAGTRSIRDLLASTGGDHLPHRIRMLVGGRYRVAAVIAGLSLPVAAAPSIALWMPPVAVLIASATCVSAVSLELRWVRNCSHAVAKPALVIVDTASVVKRAA